MGRRRYTVEQIIPLLREIEVKLSQGRDVKEACREVGIVDKTYYVWRKKYGGLKVDHARRLKELEQENVRLKKLVANMALDNAILKEAAEGNY